MDDFIGPALPTKPHQNDTEEREEIGPVLPPGFHKKYDQDEALITSSVEHIRSTLIDKEEFGPKLPKQLQNSNKQVTEDKDNSFGPSLPPGFKKSTTNSPSKISGPQLPPGFQVQNAEESDVDLDELIGPLPPGQEKGGDDKDAIAKEFELRCKKMKDRLEGKLELKALKREEWMTELPPVLQANFGVGPRQFRVNPTVIGDRSGWTDTPADKLKKAQEKQKSKTEDIVSSNVLERDMRIAEQLNSFKGEERQESLMSLHEKKRKRKLKEEQESGVANIRRPFDREVDLQANRFDDAAKKRMLKQSAGLSSRFSHGETAGKFL